MNRSWYCVNILSPEGVTYERLIMVILIPVREVPLRFFPRTNQGRIPRCDLVLEMLVDTNLRIFFDCHHNTLQLNKIVDYIFPWGSRLAWKNTQANKILETPPPPVRKTCKSYLNMAFFVSEYMMINKKNMNAPLDSRQSIGMEQHPVSTLASLGRRSRSWEQINSIATRINN